jgi:hypothetical protein
MEFKLQLACVMEFKLQLASRRLKRELLKSAQLLAPILFQARRRFQAATRALKSAISMDVDGKVGLHWAAFGAS